MNLLEKLGWNEFFESQLELLEVEVATTVARVIETQRDAWLVDDARSERWCSLAGRLRHAALRSVDLPAVGDWVVIRAAGDSAGGQITHVLPRRSLFARKAPQTGGLQVLVANIDVALVVSALNADHNVRRIERYLTLAWESGAVPMVLLTKSDLCNVVQAAIEEVEAVAPGVRVVAASAVTGEGVEALRASIAPGKTAVLLGSSGAGKSTLVNAMLGETVQAVQRTSSHLDKGRHTTTARRLLHLPGGGMIIDTPGLREVQLTDADSGVARTFEDVEQLTLRCRFGNCQHAGEPGCAIESALTDGRLDADRYRSWQKLQREAAFEARRENKNLARLEKERWKKIHTSLKRRPPKGMF